MRRIQLLLGVVCILADGLRLPHKGSTSWYDTDWRYRKLITINESMVGTNLVNFPVLIYRSTDSDLAGNAQDDGDDICFVLYSDNVTRLNHEIDTFDGFTGALNAWVNITNLSGSVNDEDMDVLW